MLLFITTWLPLCLTFSNPSLPNAEISCVPDNRLTHSGMRYFESRHIEPVRVGVGKFFQVKFRSLTQIFQSFFYSIALTHSSSFWAFGDVQVCFPVNNCSESSRMHFQVNLGNLKQPGVGSLGDRENINPRRYARRSGRDRLAFFILPHLLSPSLHLPTYIYHLLLRSTSGGSD